MEAEDYLGGSRLFRRLKNGPHGELVELGGFTGKGSLPGISGNPAGRPVGSRNRLTEDFLATLYAEI